MDEAQDARSAFYDVGAFGAVGDGKTIDSAAINRAIDAAAAAGGGTVYFRAGNYLCYSIRLKSKVAIYLDAGATIVGGRSVGGCGTQLRSGGVEFAVGELIRTTGTITGTTV